MAINAASAALMDSNIPWAGPIAAVRVNILGAETSIGPFLGNSSKPSASLLYVARKDGIVLIDMQVSCSGSNEYLHLHHQPLLFMDAQLATKPDWLLILWKHEKGCGLVHMGIRTVKLFQQENLAFSLNADLPHRVPSNVFVRTLALGLIKKSAKD